MLSIRCEEIGRLKKKLGRNSEKITKVKPFIAGKEELCF